MKLSGNTWKQQNINPIHIDSGHVWLVTAHSDAYSDIQGFGMGDNGNPFIRRCKNRKNSKRRLDFDLPRKRAKKPEYSTKSRVLSIDKQVVMSTTVEIVISAEF